MINQQNRFMGPADLRQKAEAIARKRTLYEPEDRVDLSTEGIHKSLHEMLVHQIELEMQNEELRYAQEKIKDGQTRFFDFYDLAPVGYCILSEKGIILDANLTASTLLGTPRDMLVKQPIYRFILKDDQDIYYLHRMKLFEVGNRQECELRLVKSDGACFWAYLVATVAQSEDGSSICRVVISDITARKQKEQQLKTSEENHRRLFETMVQGVLYQAADGVIVSANPAAEKILGLTFEQMQGKTSMDPRWQMIEEDGTQVSGEAHPAMVALRTGQIVGPTIRGVFHPDKNSHVWLNITAIPLFRQEENVPYQVYATFEDITERKVAQDSLQQSLDRIEAIYAALDDAIVLVDPSTRQIIECNSATAKMFDYPSEEIIGKDTYFMHVDQEHFDKFGRESIAAITDHGHYATEFEMRRRDGTVFPSESYVWPVFDSNGQIIYAVSVVRDITKRKQIQLALEQKNQELEQFVYSVSHDLKSPLITVKTFLQMLREDMLNAERSKINEDLNYIDKAADKMQMLLDALLQYSRIGRTCSLTQTLSASQTVKDCLTTLAGISQQYEVQLSVSELTQQLQGDPLHFGQIWQNLIENAIKYRGDQSQPHIEIGATQKGLEVVFYVRDNGMGIAHEHRERIFNLFSQLNAGSEGSGLGLALVKKIVSLYKGRIWVESTGEGKGSCFMFTLPEALINGDKAI